MKSKIVYMISLIIMIITLICMCVNRFITPLPDTAVRVTGIIMMIDIVAFSYSTVKLKRNHIS